MTSVKRVRSPARKARQDFALHCRRFIEELPRVRLYEKERALRTEPGSTSHFNNTRDGVVIPHQLELRSPDGRVRVVEIGRTNTDLAIRLPYDWTQRRYGNKELWYLSNRRPIPGDIFEAMLYGEIEAALRVVLDSPGERVESFLLKKNFRLPNANMLMLRGFEVPVRIETRYRNRDGKARAAGHITGWETYLLCHRCFQ